MAKRRSLVAGIKSASKSDRKKEQAFVFGRDKPAKEKKPAAIKALEPTPAIQASKPEPTPVRPAGRSPLTTRIKTELATALKRASLERQLAGEVPNTVQDILEEALEPWLREHGFLK
jgi:hypothetical protein